MAEVNITDLNESTNQMWTHKAIKENFHRWLAAPESASTIDFTKIFKTLGYSMDLTQRNLPPAVPFMIALRVIAEAKDRQQVLRATRWFLKAREEGFRFKYCIQFLKFARRALEPRRASGTSWEG